MTKEIPEAKNVHEAINHVMGRVGYVQKKDSKGLPYSFAGEADFIKAVRPHLVDVGLVVYQSDVELIERNEFTSKSGAMGINILAKFTWTWVHAVSGTSIEVTTIGESADYGDKAANKAMTAGSKYNLRQTLIIETGDDPDTTPSTEYEQARDRKAAETPNPKEAKKDARSENQWEDNVIAAVMELGLAQAKPHVINRLNQSVFMGRPFGELKIQEGVAYCMAWEDAISKYPDDTTEKRASRVDNAWEKYVSRAVKKLEGK